MSIKDKLNWVDEVDSRFNKLLRVFIVILVVCMVFAQLIASIFDAIDWSLILNLLPGWMVPDILLEFAEELEATNPVTASTTDCTEMPDGTLICKDGVRFPVDGGDGQ